MKRTILTLVAALLLTVATAQPRTHNPRPGVGPQPRPTPSILVEAQHGETFRVYVDGEPINPTPQSKVLADKLDSRAHEVIVVLQHPAHKAGHVQLYAGIPATVVTVHYDPRHQQMILSTADGANARPHGDPTQTGHPHSPNGTHATPPIPPTPHVPPTLTTPPPPPVATDQWVDEMETRLRGQSFDKERLSTAMGMLEHGKLLTSAQLARIVATFSFSNTQVEFLKAAYRHCADPENYERALDVMTFSSNRQEVRDYIKQQR